MATLPIKGYPVNQNNLFGANPQLYRGTAVVAHEGWDWSVPVGTPVYAVKDGTIGLASNNYGNYGRALAIKHDDGQGTIYAHLDRFVRQSGRVKEGELIAYSGNTGFTQGPHLHLTWQPQYMANLNNGYFGGADPAILFKGGATIDPRYTQAIRGYAAAKYALLLMRPIKPEELPQWDNATTDQIDNAIYASPEYRAIWKKWIPGYPDSEIDKKVAAKATTAFDLLNHYVSLSNQGNTGAAQKLAELKAKLAELSK